MSNTRIVSRKTQRQEKSKKNSINYKCQSTLLPSEFQTIELAAAIICCRRVLFAIASIYGLPLHRPNFICLTNGMPAFHQQNQNANRRIILVLPKIAFFKFRTNIKQN